MSNKRPRSPTESPPHLHMPWMVPGSGAVHALAQSPGRSELLQHASRHTGSSVTTQPTTSTSGPQSRLEIADIIRSQLLRNRTDRALRSLKLLPNFPPALNAFVQEECRLQAQGILSEKDSPRASFSLHSIESFSYKDQLRKFQRTNPLLLASIIGTLSKDKNSDAEDLGRKGFGGSNRAEDIDLTPTICQSVSRVLKNRHPYSITTLPCLNSLSLWANRVPCQLYHLFNSLGDCFR